jgi:hypothetical protein
VEGWKDAVIADFDVDVFSCSRRAHIYHNPGGAVGSQPTLREEAQQASGGWRGVVGMQAGDFTGTFDIAPFDIDNDGDTDMVFGRCSGTFVWMNQAVGCSTTYSYGVAVANSTGQPGHIDSTGSTSISANDLVLTGSGFPANKTALFIYGATRLFSPAPFGNGSRWIGNPIQRLPTFQTDASGNASYAANFTTFPLSTLSPGDTRYFQLWYRDPAAGGAFYNASDALQVPICP